jgi:hypothetical protein
MCLYEQLAARRIAVVDGEVRALERTAGRPSGLRLADGVLGRGPATVTRSVQTHVAYDDPARTRAVVRDLAAIGVTHVVLNLPRPVPPGIARRPAAEVIGPIRAERGEAA